MTVLPRVFFLLVLHCFSLKVSADRGQCLPDFLDIPKQIHAGQYVAGYASMYAEEGPAHLVAVDGFRIDRHEVTNAQFAAFVNTTGYVTDAEKGMPGREDTVGGFVFMPPEPGVAVKEGSWWQFTAGASWRHPYGPGSSIEGKDTWPVVQVTQADALAYAAWAKGRLPTEDEWEFAARAGQKGKHAAPENANVWQGPFPSVNNKVDGFSGIAPVGCYKENAFGLYDMIGNVWELTASPYFERRDAVAGENTQSGYDPQQPGVPVVVIKGGSYLCAENYCARFRPAARQAQDRNLATSHVGFRLAYDK